MGVLGNLHLPAKYRVNGLVVNAQSLKKAISCKAGQPMPINNR